MGEKVLRSVLQKQGTSNFSNINYIFGSQGVYTEMFSGLNLEEQLRLGGACDVSYQVGEDKNKNATYKIIEKYYLNGNSNFYYKVVTETNSAILDFLTTEQTVVPTNGADFLVAPTPFLVLQGENSQNVIKITLSAVKVTQESEQDDPIAQETKLKEKYIVFSSQSGIRYISEVLSGVSTSSASV